MKYTFITTLALSLTFSAHAMDKNEALLQTEIANIAAELDQLATKEDAPPASIEQLHKQLSEKHARLDAIIKFKESLN